MKGITMLALAMVFISTTCSAWEGFDYETGTYIEIEKNNTVKRGQDIEIYNYSTGTYENVEVERVQRRGNSVDVEVFDIDTGEYRTLEMDSR